MIVGQNTGGGNALGMTGTSAYQSYSLSTGVPFILFNGSGYNGAFNSGTTATDVPDDDPTSYTITPLGGRNKYSAIAALKAIS